MRKAFTMALAAALAGGFAMTEAGAPARGAGADKVARATDSYRGAFKRVGPNTRVTIKVRTRDGVARSIRSLRYRQLPASCELSGDSVVNDGWRFTRFRVNRQRRFSITGRVADGSTIDFTGRFSKSFNKVKGRFQSTVEFAEPQPKTCETVSAAYAARRGAGAAS
jgi:hypothetical protein